MTLKQNLKSNLKCHFKHESHHDFKTDFETDFETDSCYEIGEVFLFQLQAIQILMLMLSNPNSMQC